MKADNKDLLRTINRLIVAYGGIEKVAGDIISELENKNASQGLILHQKPLPGIQSNLITGWGLEKEQLFLELLKDKTPEYIRTTLGLNPGAYHYRTKKLNITRRYNKKAA